MEEEEKEARKLLNYQLQFLVVKSSYHRQHKKSFVHFAHGDRLYYTYSKGQEYYVTREWHKLSPIYRVALLPSYCEDTDAYIEQCLPLMDRSSKCYFFTDDFETYLGSRDTPSKTKPALP